MDSKTLQQKAQCCECGRPMQDSPHLNLFVLNKVATWKFPVSNNIAIPNDVNHAVAIVCDACLNALLDEHASPRLAVEIDPMADRLIYHLAEDLGDIPETVKAAYKAAEERAVKEIMHRAAKTAGPVPPFARAQNAIYHPLNN